VAVRLEEPRPDAAGVRDEVQIESVFGAAHLSYPAWRGGGYKRRCSAIVGVAGTDFSKQHMNFLKARKIDISVTTKLPLIFLIRTFIFGLCTITSSGKTLFSKSNLLAGR